MNNYDTKVLEEIIENAVVSGLEKRARIDEETHIKDHQFIQKLRAEDEKISERVEKLKQQILGWATIAIIGYFGYHLLEALKSYSISILNKLFWK